ncbi:DUF3017 domain-containing protein [Quadrisphaera setariae]|uniref:DUF3017 domain-containing protein n=1 Tax=Quadrisphaera setariae TaxID=2593304 RepID=A0A5C8ZLL8_9ACTN|nr:DUF3017 domain-containing protein [Quadrisphaera setariae]TXR57876.1 DUF3017 domain-containing protein [Quadrisphaera setariae]
MEPARTDSGPPDPHPGPASDPAPAADQRPARREKTPWPPPAALVWGFGAGLLAVLLAAALVSFWLAGLLLSGLLLVLAVLHLVMPIASLGPLAVRTPWVDAATCLVLAVGVAVLAVVAPRGPVG